MATISDEGLRSLVKGLGAFMRQSAATDLPRSLRALRNFTDKALTGRSEALLAALEDEGIRAKILEWLDAKPTLDKETKRILRAAATREDGWEKALGARARPSRKKTSTADAEAVREKIEKHKERASAAQAELRRVRQEARDEIARAGRDKETAVRQVSDLQAESKRLRAEIEGLKRKVDAAEGATERERRRARKQALSAEEKQEALRVRLKDAKTENAELKRRVSRSEASSKIPAPAKAKRPSVPTKRKTLPVPKGLHADARQTLERWLARSNVILVIDGYNVTKHEKGFGELTLETQRDRLISELQRLSARFPKVSMIAVFDGSEVGPGTARRRKGRVKIEYSLPDEIADDHIVAKVEDLPAHPVVVVTSDRELQERVGKLDATVATSPQFLELLRKA